MKRKVSDRYKASSSSSSSSVEDKKKEGAVSKTGGNSSNKYLIKLNKLKQTIPCWDTMFAPTTSEEDRDAAWSRLEVIGHSIQQEFSWACPDARALRIAAHFSPLVEIGAGKGYWSKLLKETHACDVLCFDKYVATAYKKEEMWDSVLEGGPEVLQDKRTEGRNLFLCYPDEAEAMSMPCLDNFVGGEYVIHVGELFVTGTKTGGAQSPWGRSTSSDFQVALSESFSLVLQAKLPCFPYANDYISVWKRKVFVPGRGGSGMEGGSRMHKGEGEGGGGGGGGDEEEDEEAAEEEEEDVEAEEKEEEEEEEEEFADEWASLAAEFETPPLDVSCPAFSHLLT